MNFKIIKIGNFTLATTHEMTIVEIGKYNSYLFTVVFLILIISLFRHVD